MAEQKKTILSLQGWRAIMMVIVVAAHLFGVTIIHGGAGEVMPFFFVLSGFVLALNYKGNNEKITFNAEKQFVLKRLKKVYPLYFAVLFICLLYYVFLSLLAKQEQSAFEYLKYFFADIFMLQAWIPLKEYFMSLNGVSWFLASLFFSYALFLPLMKMLRKVGKKPQGIYALLTGVLLLASVYQVLCKGFFNLPQYYTYVFPIYRGIEFFAGMILAQIFAKANTKEHDKTVFSVLEIFIVLYFAAEFLILKYLPGAKGIEKFASVPQLLMMCALIFVFAFEKGVISKAVSNKLFLSFASISFEVYLIHQAMQNITGSILNQFGLVKFTGVITVILTLLSAIGWKYAVKKIHKSRKLNKTIG